MRNRGPYHLCCLVGGTLRAIVAWRAVHSRELDSSEQYAAAKMRLFRAFDELKNLREESLNLVVDETNVEELLEALDLT